VGTFCNRLAGDGQERLAPLAAMRFAASGAIRHPLK
jgi:hypothetical protein